MYVCIYKLAVGSSQEDEITSGPTVRIGRQEGVMYPNTKGQSYVSDQ